MFSKSKYQGQQHSNVKNIVAIIINAALLCFVIVTYLNKVTHNGSCYYYQIPGGCEHGNKLLMYIAFMCLMVYLIVQAIMYAIKSITSRRS
jgi:hypothetical protein